MNKEFTDNWDFQQGYYGQVERILKQNAPHFVNVRIASKDQDMKQATDFIVIIEGGEIAVRIRRANVRWRDLTIRSRIGHAKTEIHKIREGFGRYYLYCWTDANNAICDWILVDLDLLRESGLLENRKEIPNKDGYTAFINIPAIELAANGCLIASAT